MKIITGATGETHVTSNSDGEFNQGIFGDGLVVLQNGNKLAATVVNNNLIEVKDGDLIFQGRHALIEPGMTDELTIGTGAVDLNRNDLIVIRYQLNGLTGYESMTLEAIQGEETGGEAHDPDYVDADIRTGALIAEAPLYRVKIRGISIDAIEPLFTATAGSLESRVGSVENNLTVENTSFIFDTHNGEFGWNESPERGADTFHPFKQKHTETYTPTERKNNNDMGESHKYRYVNTNSVPNSNSGTYKATTRSSSIDMGATNTYRYVNTSGVPSIIPAYSSNTIQGGWQKTRTASKTFSAGTHYIFVFIAVYVAYSSRPQQFTISATATSGTLTSVYEKWMNAQPDEDYRPCQSHVRIYKLDNTSSSTVNVTMQTGEYDGAGCVSNVIWFT